MRLLVTGGAGYVGSVCSTVLLEQGHEVVILDDLSTGNVDAVPAGAEFVEGDIATAAAEVLGGGAQPRFGGVLHFAAQSLVGESVEHPDKYWHGNVVATLALLDAIRASGTPRLVFSSTAATYGEPDRVPITEDAPARPTNPYGATKLAIDHAISSYTRAYGLAATSLRYFNVAGAYHGAGENRVVETHLIPLVLQVALGQREHISVFGTDWPTKDGTAVRDYIHVKDLADAHLLALAAARPGEHAVYNLGSGEGFTVREVIEACRRVTGLPITVVDAPRRAGDPAVLIASSRRAVEELGWKPQHTSLDEIVADAWVYLQELGDRSHAARR
ncbi:MULTISPECIES: UDP-glucose 4-epimerase GalE [unclassified Rhodococcus (in: high G+C Gram-positive bacteria)]|uniref:UDP-glucose 4-epimerase GalE n=1 Tax=unclassified Rhodococcus (in: high G+C Gram-positive bacteria) TaxID=192944 RepID=UPI00092A2E53|nr:UDP-glucose 4-epimerase GalE [Rhodococcus sp. M8]OLL17595.1 UDP-glucose 4-epimerase GalE [Rhodococcus sp. M8]QPG45869.1 UDP-glucose 4-epimerase GalE [Rhodococcus sp. M8]